MRTFFDVIVIWVALGALLWWYFEMFHCNNRRD